MKNPHDDKHAQHMPIEPLTTGGIISKLLSVRKDVFAKKGGAYGGSNENGADGGSSGDSEGSGSCGDNGEEKDGGEGEGMTYDGAYGGKEGFVEMLGGMLGNKIDGNGRTGSEGD